MRTEILLDGSAFYDRLERDIEAARDRVWLQTLTFEADDAGSPLAEVLSRCGAPDRRFLVDSFTRFFISDRFVYAPHNLLDRAHRREVRATSAALRDLDRAGVRVRHTNPAGFLLRRLFARDHKKLVVIDDNVAYIGGINFSDHNFAWRDLMVRIEDPEIAAYLAADFEATWSGAPHAPALETERVAFHNIDGADNPARLEPVLDLIRGARDSIHVISPYITDPFCAELAAASARGVRVTLLGTSGNNRGFLDRYVRSVAARSGFDLRLYQGRMNHMKAMLVDGRSLVLGSSNFDWLSHSLLGEIVAVFRDRELIASFVRDVLEPDLAAAAFPRPVGRMQGWIAARQVALLARLVPVLCPPRGGVAVPAIASDAAHTPARATGLAFLRRRLSRAAGAAALLASISLGACAPVISHGPRVRDGSAAGVSAAIVSNTDGEAMQVIVPYVTGGSTRGAGNGGRQFTAQMVIPTAAFGDDAENEGLIYGLQGDYYRQLPTTPGSRLVHGFGVHGGFFQVMPYGQWGIYQDGVGVYTTQGFGSMGIWMGLHPEFLFWSPGLGAEVDLDAVTVRASLSTLVGWNFDRMERMDGMPVSIGIAIETGPALQRASGGSR